jgi:hypothetical protein
MLKVKSPMAASLLGRAMPCNRPRMPWRLRSSVETLLRLTPAPASSAAPRPLAQMLFDEEDFDGIGPYGVFQKEPVFRLFGAENMADLLARIRLDDAKSGNHCMCTGAPWLRFFRHDEEIASFTWHHGDALRWHAGSWSGDGALTDESAAAVPAWLRAEGCTSL